MAANAQSQHRCVFVGNIPYDATEEQITQICEEVGPVVSFRLVTDRETGKPKGYGFCEYKDEETALSARRNLQGYDINGRQLRVDFAENDKNADKNREQGRGGPCVGPNVDAPKQVGGQAVFGHPSVHQPVGDSVATAAASVMAGALGLAQTAGTPNQMGLRTPSLLGTDPLTQQLAKMSRSQLTEVLSEFKALATQNKEQARKLLLAIPNLSKAIFQVEIMLGVVSPQMLQTPNIRQASTQPVQSLLQNSQTLSGLPPLPQNKSQLGLMPPAQDSRGVSADVPNQYNTLQKFITHTQIQHPQLNQNQASQQAQLVAQFGVSSHPSTHPQSLIGLSAGQQIPVPTSSLNQQMQHPISQNIGPVPSSNPGYNAATRSQTVATHTSLLVNPQFSATGIQHSTSTSSVMLEDMDMKGHALNIPSKTNQIDRAPKLVKVNGGSTTPSQVVSVTSHMSAPLQSSGVPGRQTPKNEIADTGKQATQMQLPPDLDPSVLQQLLNLTPQQLSLLPPDQQQQVMQLQRMLRQAT